MQAYSNRIAQNNLIVFRTSQNRRKKYFLAVIFLKSMMTEYIIVYTERDKQQNINYVLTSSPKAKKKRINIFKLLWYIRYFI